MKNKKTSLEVLIACMHQTDFKLYKTMNLKSNAIFANQADFYGYKAIDIGDSGFSAKMFSTADRGVGKNRNLSLLNAEADVLLLSDEDMIYKDDYVKTVTEAFVKCPQADLIVFDLNYLNTVSGTKKKKITKFHRLHWYNSGKFGAARIAIKREPLQKANIWFSVLYGGGAPFSSGEDSLFIREALTKGLKLYAYPGVIADVKQETSSWFTGYHKKFYIDKGVLLANSYSKMKYLLAFYYSYRFRNKSELSMFEIFKYICFGIRKFKVDLFV